MKIVSIWTENNINEMIKDDEGIVSVYSVYTQCILR